MAQPKKLKLQKVERSSTAEHCCVPLCQASSRYNSVLSFHSVPGDAETRKKWMVAIRRDNFTVTNRTRVCSRHFNAEDFRETAGRRLLKKGVVPSLFAFSLPPQRLEVWGRSERPAEAAGLEDSEEDAGSGGHASDHDYASHPDPAVVDLPLEENKFLREEISRLRKEIASMALRQRFGIHRFANSDQDIRFFTRSENFVLALEATRTKFFFTKSKKTKKKISHVREDKNKVLVTRFASYSCLMHFWALIEPELPSMVHVRHAHQGTFPEPSSTAARSLQPINELFLFLNFLALGSEQRDLADRYGVHQSTVSRIITTWSNFLYTVLGVVRIWIPAEKIKERVPAEFKPDYADTAVILDCTELRSQCPTSPLLQSEEFSAYKSHCTLKGLIGIAPHGAITFISPLYAGSISDKQIMRESGIISVLRPGMAIMVDRGFLVGEFVPCKIYRPPFVFGRSQMSAPEVGETQEIAHLRVHVERCRRRLKEHKLFDSEIPLGLFGNINQLYTVACLLMNYENGPLAKACAKRPQSQLR